MNCQRAQSLLLQSLEHAAGSPIDPGLQDHLDRCPDCQRALAEYTQALRALDVPVSPGAPARLRENFYEMLEAEKARPVVEPVRPGASPRRSPLLRRLSLAFAACALVACGFLAGRRGVTAPDSSSPAPFEARDELAALRRQLDQQQTQLTAMTRLVGYSILQQQQNPANTRLKDVLAVAAESAPSDREVDELIAALTLDPSANVRLRAIQGLYAHAGRDVVRAGVLAALPRENNPLVQLELIDFVAAAKLQGASPVLEKFAADAGMNDAVRGAAQTALSYL